MGLKSVSEENLSKLERLLEQGAREELLTIFYKEIAGMSQEELKQLKGSQLWSMRLKLAHTIPRELRSEESWTFDPELYKEFFRPTLLLIGEESPKWAYKTTNIIKESLPNSQKGILIGQGHLAIITKPKIVEVELTQFLSAN